MEYLELQCFQIISAVGVARSNFVEAIYAAKAKNIEKAKNLVAQGKENFQQGHLAHTSLIQQEAGGNPVSINLLLVHAEDQMMATECFQFMAQEFIDLYQSIHEKERNL